MQATSSQPTKGSTASGQEGPPAACQLTNRKARSTKQLDLHGQSLTGSSLPHRGLGPEDAEYANLIGAMDNDLDRPESISAETLQDQSSQSIQNKGTFVLIRGEQEASVIVYSSLTYVFILFAVLESKGKLRGKAKAQRKKEEKEKKSTVKIQGDELKDNLADNDDSSSTTTETSNPDVETNIKEVRWSNKSCVLYHLYTCTLSPRSTSTRDGDTRRKNLQINLMCLRQEHKKLRRLDSMYQKHFKKQTMLWVVCVDAQITKMCTLSLYTKTLNCHQEVSHNCAKSQFQ